MISSSIPWRRALPRIFLPTLALFLLHRLRIAIAPLANQFDPFFHFFGGVSIAWLVWRGYVALRESDRLPVLPRWMLFVTCLSVTALVGVLWEFYEYAVFIWIDPTYDIRLPDTMSDLLLDLCGGTLMGLMATIRFKKQ